LSRCERVAANPRREESEQKREEMSADQLISTVIVWVSLKPQKDGLSQGGGERHPKELIPIEERNDENFRRLPVIERHGRHGGQRK